MSTCHSLSCSFYCEGQAVTSGHPAAQGRVQRSGGQTSSSSSPAHTYCSSSCCGSAERSTPSDSLRPGKERCAGPLRLGKPHRAGAQARSPAPMVGGRRGSGRGSAAGGRMFTLQLERSRRDGGPAALGHGQSWLPTSVPAAVPASPHPPLHRTAWCCHAGAW